ncbi:hypothetical protein M513_00343, partial [Trichuris suis]
LVFKKRFKLPCGQYSRISSSKPGRSQYPKNSVTFGCLGSRLSSSISLTKCSFASEPLKPKRNCFSSHVISQLKMHLSSSLRQRIFQIRARCIWLCICSQRSLLRAAHRIRCLQKDQNSCTTHPSTGFCPKKWLKRHSTLMITVYIAPPLLETVSSGDTLLRSQKRIVEKTAIAKCVANIHAKTPKEVYNGI